MQPSMLDSREHVGRLTQTNKLKQDLWKNETSNDKIAGNGRIKV